MYRGFLGVFTVLQLWMICGDFVLGRGFTGSSAINVGMGATAAFLVSTSRSSHHIAGGAATWALLLTGIVLRGAGLID